jgi:hypothetical protein
MPGPVSTAAHAADVIRRLPVDQVMLGKRDKSTNGMVSEIEMFVKPWRLQRCRFAAWGLDEHHHPRIVGCRGCSAALHDKKTTCADDRRLNRLI